MKLALQIIFYGFLVHTDFIKSSTLHGTNLNIENNFSFVFDSYNQLTELEDFPDVCAKYSDENCARLWLEEINEVETRNDNRLANVQFKYAADINAANLKLLNSFQMNGIRISHLFRKKIEKFQWKSFRDPELRKIFRRLTATIVSKNESISRQIVDLQNNISYIYNNGQPCFGHCIPPGEVAIIDVFRNERDYDKLAGFWTSWRNVTGAQFRHLFIEKMHLANIGARENGYTDSASFGLVEDFEEANFKNIVLGLYEDILPLYKELHAYVRYCLARYYPGRFDETGPIPAHILGNVWGQQWVNIFPIIKKCQKNKQDNNILEEANQVLSSFSVKKMFLMAEQFYTSIGMYKMTDRFWERSVLTQLKGKIIDCHGSAHDFSNTEDYRIMMCTKKNVNDFTTIHHEMGHIEYFMAYRNLPFYYRNSANSGFHESIGDTIALAVKTPEHLHSVGIISQIPDTYGFDIDYLMMTALEKVAFLPFALTMDSYIWSVYNGSVPTSDLNKHWWYLRYKYQGLKPPVKRSENDFDAGAKYHIAFDVPYIRYFVSFILQFQFYDSMCDLSGHEGPLHRCDFYKSKEAGSKMLKMLKQGRKNHWRETLKILTGTTNIQSKSLLKFFQPLHKWLRQQNKKLNIRIGW